MLVSLFFINFLLFYVYSPHEHLVIITLCLPVYFSHSFTSWATTVVCLLTRVLFISFANDSRVISYTFHFKQIKFIFATFLFFIVILSSVVVAVHAGWRLLYVVTIGLSSSLCICSLCLPPFPCTAIPYDLVLILMVDKVWNTNGVFHCTFPVADGCSVAVWLCASQAKVTTMLYLHFTARHRRMLRCDAIVFVVLHFKMNKWSFTKKLFSIHKCLDPS